MSASAAWRRLGPPIATALVLGILGAFLYRERSYIAESYSPHPGAFVAVVGLTVATIWLRGIANQLHFGSLGVRAGAMDWFRVITVTSFTGYLPLSAGVVAKAVILKRVHAMPYRRFAVGQTTLLLVVLATNGLAGLGVLAWRFPEQLFGVVGLGFVLMLMAGTVLVLPTRLREVLSSSWFPFAANVGPEARRSWPGVALCQLGALAATALGLQLCFSTGNQQVGFAACVLFTAAAVLTRFVTIVPGALGLREFLIGGLAVLTGFELRDAVIASTLARIAEMLVVFGLGGIFTWSLSADLARGGDGGADASREP